MAGSSAQIHTHDVPDMPPVISPVPPTIVKKRSTSPPLQQVNNSAQPDPTDIIDLTNSDDDNDDGYDYDNFVGARYPSIPAMLAEDGIGYPSIPTMLAELHGEYRYLNFPQYQAVLMDNGFLYVSQLIEEQVGLQLQNLGVGIGVVNLLLSRAKRVMRRAQKMKQEPED